MKKTLLALAVLLPLSGCGRDNFESLRKQQVATAKEAADLLSIIKDKETADKAKPRLKQLGDRWRDLQKRMDALPSPSAEEELRAKRLYEDEFEGAKTRFVKEYLRVLFVPGGKEALDEIGEIFKKKK
jgi:hypothetical protein